MYFYIDGDNGPGSRTVGLSKLKKEDVVKVFYADNNKHYSQACVRDGLSNNCRGTVEFMCRIRRCTSLRNIRRHH